MTTLERAVHGREIGTLKPFMRGDPRRPWPCLVIAKPKCGSADKGK